MNPQVNPPLISISSDSESNNQSSGSSDPDGFDILQHFLETWQRPSRFSKFFLSTKNLFIAKRYIPQNKESTTYETTKSNQPAIIPTTKQQTIEKPVENQDVRPSEKIIHQGVKNEVEQEAHEKVENRDEKQVETEFEKDQPWTKVLNIQLLINITLSIKNKKGLLT